MGSTKTVEQKSNSTQTIAPPSWTMPGISDAAAKVTAALNSLPGNKYQGQFVAQPDYNPAIQAYQGAAQAANTNAGIVDNTIAGYKPATANYNMSSPMMDTTSGLNGAIHSAIAPVTQQLLEQTLPGLRTSAMDSGAYSNDRAMVTLPGQAIRDANNNEQNIAATLGYQNLNDSANRQLQAYGLDTARGLGDAQLGATQQEQFMQNLPALLDQAMKMRTGSGDILQAAAGMQGQMQQNQINNAMAANDYSWKYPFQGLDIASSLLSQLSGNYGTTTSSGTNSTVEKTGGAGAIASGLLGAAGLVGSFAMPGGGSLGGNLLGSLFKK
jgi:hypothetical protein